MMEHSRSWRGGLFRARIRMKGVERMKARLLFVMILCFYATKHISATVCLEYCVLQVDYK